MAASSEPGAAASEATAAAPAKVTKREDYLAWDDYFMCVAFLSAKRSKVSGGWPAMDTAATRGLNSLALHRTRPPAPQDPSTQVGACIVDDDNRIVAVGYNGFPRGCSDDELPWAREAESRLDTKYMYVCHAEVNAVMNKNTASLKGARMYVALFPCNECAKLIIQAGITEVVYLDDKYHDEDSYVASRRLFDMAKVGYRRLEPSSNQVVLDLRPTAPAP